jgi:hypothetical protein
MRPKQHAFRQQLNESAENHRKQVADDQVKVLQLKKFKDPVHIEKKNVPPVHRKTRRAGKSC